jgi:MFS family permease
MGWLVFIVVAATFIIPFYLELVQGYSPKVMGLVMMLVPVSMGVVAPGAGWLADRFGARGITLVGLIVCVAGCLCVASLDGDLDLKGVILRMVPIGVGMGLFQSPNNSAIMGAVPRHRLGLASGLMTLSRTLGHTTGIPLVGTLFTSWTLAVANVPGLKEVINAPPEALVAGLSAVYRGAALIITLATLLAALALYIDHRRHRPKAKAVGEAA